MKKKEMENLGISPSLLGYGTMRFPCLENGEIDEPRAEALLDHAIQNGVTYIDTAYPYHEKKSEPFVGKVLKKYSRDSFYLATKLPLWEIETLDDAKKMFENQLKRLQVEYVDFYLLHALDLEKWEKALKLDIVSYLLEEKKKGRIRYLGFSFHDEFEVFERILTYQDWDFCQIQLNYMDLEIQAGLKGYKLAEKLGIPIVIMEPVKGGTLANLPKDISDIFYKANQEASIASWALRFVASFPNVKVVLSGMSNEEQLEDNLQTFSNFVPLDEKELEVVEQVAHTICSRMQNGCTGCEYCMPCPFGVNIPGNFKIWNDDAMYENHEKAQNKYDALKEAKASFCKQCGACEKVCPQHLHIREDLEKIKNIYE